MTIYEIQYWSLPSLNIFFHLFICLLEIFHDFLKKSSISSLSLYVATHGGYWLRREGGDGKRHTKHEGMWCEVCTKEKHCGKKTVFVKPLKSTKPWWYMWTLFSIVLNYRYNFIVFCIFYSPQCNFSRLECKYSAR